MDTYSEKTLNKLEEKIKDYFCKMRKDLMKHSLNL